MDCTENSRHVRLRFLCGSCALFMKSVSTDFNKFFFKNRSYNIIYTFKNYFVIIFLVEFGLRPGANATGQKSVLFSFYFSTINNIQIVPEIVGNLMISVFIVLLFFLAPKQL